MSGAIRLRPVVRCGQCLRQMVLDAANVRAAVAPAMRAGWRKEGRRWLCPLCLAARDGTGVPQQIKERIADEVAVMSSDDLALMHSAVVTEIRRRSRP